MRGGRRMALWRNREEIRSAEAARKATLKRARCTGVVHHTPVETGCKGEPARGRRMAWRMWSCGECGECGQVLIYEVFGSE